MAEPTEATPVVETKQEPTAGKTVVLKEGDKVYNQEQFEKAAKDWIEREKKPLQENLTKVQTELEALKRAKVEGPAAEQAVKESFDALLEVIPKENRGFVPSFGTIAERAKFITDNMAKLLPVASESPPAATPTIPGSGPKPPPTAPLSPNQETEQEKMRRLGPAKYRQQFKLKKPGEGG